jgi:hypothetical protein
MVDSGEVNAQKDKAEGDKWSFHKIQIFRDELNCKYHRHPMIFWEKSFAVPRWWNY